MIGLHACQRANPKRLALCRESERSNSRTTYLAKRTFAPFTFAIRTFASRTFAVLTFATFAEPMLGFSWAGVLATMAFLVVFRLLSRDFFWIVMFISSLARFFNSPWTKQYIARRSPNYCVRVRFAARSQNQQHTIVDGYKGYSEARKSSLAG